jgi:hypothetical protein
MSKYLNGSEIFEFIGDIILDKEFATVSQDSYNEQSIGLAIKKTKMEKELLCCALNLSIVGFGNQKYGQYRIGETLYEIKTIFNKANIKYDNRRSAILPEDTLTPNRLCRFFRYHTRRYITDNNIESYMYRKYSTRDAKYKTIVFRGAEYLGDLTNEQRNYLIKTFKTLDSKLTLDLTSRVIRIFEAQIHK